MYLGLDFGTSSVKGVLIDAKQKILATASAPLKVSRPHPGWSEQNPDDWWKACNRVMTLGKLKPKAIAAVEGIGLSGQQHGATLLDKDGKALRPCILWNDARSFRECEDIENRRAQGRAAFPATSRWRASPRRSCVWVKKHEPKIFAKVAKVLLPKDYVRLRMTGDYASDMSDSSGTYWLDIAKRDWSELLLAASRMRLDQMPELFEGTDPTGRLTPAVAKAWGMPKRPVVAGGGGDNAASACGIGAVTDNAGARLDRHLRRDLRLQRQLPPQRRPRGPCLLPCRARHLAPDGRDPLGRREPRMAGGRPGHARAETHRARSARSSPGHRPR